jgi:hypothetical protein
MEAIKFEIQVSKKAKAITKSKRKKYSPKEKYKARRRAQRNFYNKQKTKKAYKKVRGHACAR